MSDIEREPCPRCGEPAALIGRVCPHCQGSLLVEVVLDAPVADPRARYQIARALASFGPPAPDFSSAQRELASPRPVLARGLTREAARRLLANAAELGLPGQAVFPRKKPRAESRVPPWAVAGALGAMLLLAVLIAFWGRKEPGGAPEPPPQGTTLQPDALPARVSEGRDARPLSARDLAELATPSTVVLRNGGSLGSGFFVQPDLILTNAHVVAAEREPVEIVFSDGRELQGQVRSRDARLDIALVQVSSAAAEPLALGDSTELRTGDRVVFVGTPEGMDFTVHEGIVSHTARHVLGVAYLQIDANVNPGNSGGPVLDTTGRVVGIVTAKVNGAEGLGIALPINYAYEGDPPLLPKPTPRPDSKTWRARLDRVQQEERETALEISTATMKPVLVGAAIRQKGEILATIARISDREPVPENFLFTFRKPGRMLCGVPTSVERWGLAGRTEVSANPRIAHWLEDNNISQDVYVGVAEVSLRRCSEDELRGAVMVLEGADEGSDRVQL
ncbi:MAG TPA: trypsin-like peptidase domain-containing protein [Thermoanaerobaculia bacterium]|nr:trypsin-like peptidase domain-containing protein [Thermoanaerobaculia bacterium]